MKKIFTLSVVLLLAFVSIGHAQNFGGNPPSCSLPAGFTLSQGDRMTTYNNPMNNCKEDCGIVTPGVGGNNPGNIIFPPETPSGANVGVTMHTCFNLFIFDANLRCESNRDFQCVTTAKVYIVPSSYNSVQTPDAANNYGETEYTLRALGQQNCVTVTFNKAPVAGEQYRLFLDFGKGTSCVQQNTKYVIDVLPQGGPLPLSLTSFLAGRTNAAVSLNWKIAASITVSSFEIQRSFDNVAFTKIATVLGNSNSGSEQSYSYTDNTNNSKSVSFYRLKLIKQSGEISYSDIKTVKAFGGKADYVIFPNPAYGNAKITITDLNEPTKIQLLDNSGRLVKSATLTNSNTVELNGVVKGAYMVRITGTVSGQTEVRKLTVIN